jgi:membrane associated rhomboid family serine protease
MPEPPDSTRQFARTLTDGARRAGAQLWRNFRFMFMLVAALWMIEVADQIIRQTNPACSLDFLGIMPRTLWGLLGIFFAPFIHGSFAHLLNNTLPLLVLGWIVLLGGRCLFFKVSGIVTVCAGAGTWIFGTAPGPHLGSSGVIYGYLGFLLVRGFLELSIRWVIVSVLIGILYSGALGGFLPAGHISVVGHVFGFVGGVLAGWLLFYLPRRRWEKRHAAPKKL